MNDERATMQKVRKSEKRLGSVELARFIAMLMIMAHHEYILGYEKGEYAFSLGWIWVDFFFILTGYFTAKHFLNTERTDENLSKSVMEYHINKFRKFFVIAVIAIVLQLVINAFINGYGLASIAIDLSKMPYEILFLTSSGVSEAGLVPIWYLSAVFITLPVVVLLFVRFRKYWYVVSWIIPLLYIGRFGVNTDRTWPNDLLRSFSYLILGTFVLLIAEEVRKAQLSTAIKCVLTVVEIGSFLLAVVITLFNYDTNLTALLFVVNAIIMLSGKSYSSLLNSWFVSFLGKLSIPMFLFQWCVGTMISGITNNLSVKLVLYYSGTIVVAVVITILQDIFMKRAKK